MTRCAVINKAILKRHGKDSGEGEIEREQWNELYLPPSVVSPSERHQILDLIPTWADSLLVCHRSRELKADGQASGMALPELQRPLRPFFIHPSTSQPPHITPNAAYTPIICLSASRCMGITGLQDEVPSVTRVGSRNVGFEYVPGAGDDDELWAKVGFSLLRNEG